MRVSRTEAPTRGLSLYPRSGAAASRAVTRGVLATAQAVYAPEQGMWVYSIRLSLLAEGMPGALSADEREGCERRYGGEVLGFSAQAVVDRLHLASAFGLGFARGLNDTPKVLALLVAARWSGNTLEQAPVFLSSLWLYALFADSASAGTLGALYLASRALYPLFYCWISRFTFGFEPVTQTGTLTVHKSNCRRRVSATAECPGSLVDLRTGAASSDRREALCAASPCS